MSEEITIDWQKGTIAFFIVVGIFLINAVFNPPEVPDKEKPPISYQTNGEPIYPTKNNPYYICGFLLIAAILLAFIFFSGSFFNKGAYIMTFPEAYRHIPIDERVKYELPPSHEIDTIMVVPKDGGKTCFATYRYKGGLARIKVNLLSDFKDSSGDYSRKSPLIAWTCRPVSSSSAQTVMRSDTDTLKKIAEVDRQVEKLTGSPLTAEMFKKKYQETKKRMEEGSYEGEE